MSSFEPNSLFNLSGRIALVTGGGTGIGSMMARGFAGSGAKVYITGRRFEVLQAFASEWKGKLEGEITPSVVLLVSSRV